MGAVLTDQAASISFRTAHLSAALLKTIIRQYTANQNHSADTEGGRLISDRELNARGATTHINLDFYEDLCALQKELHNYGVDYSIQYQPAADTYEVWFLGKDIERVNEGLSRAVKQWDKDAGRKPFAERLSAAEKTAEKRNAERQRQMPDKNKEIPRMDTREL